ncbi:MAG: hypothetical protein IJB49_00535 [Clostridia bacterium]|nr:hypothetical protein [Clostridia bacterium]
MKIKNLRYEISAHIYMMFSLIGLILFIPFEEFSLVLGANSIVLSFFTAIGAIEDGYSVVATISKFWFFIYPIFLLVSYIIMIAKKKYYAFSVSVTLNAIFTFLSILYKLFIINNYTYMVCSVLGLIISLVFSVLFWKFDVFNKCLEQSKCV